MDRESASVVNARHDIFAIGGVDIVDDDLGAFLRETSRDTASKSCARACNDGNLSLATSKSNLHSILGSGLPTAP